jgi:hypothetical protein
MITQEFLESLDLPPDKAAALQDAMKKDSAYRNMLHHIGVFPGAVEAIMRTVDAAALDGMLSGEALTAFCAAVDGE